MLPVLDRTDWQSAIAEGISLRDYQSECMDFMAGAFDSGKKSILISIPTGGGKTLIFNTFVLRRGYRALIIAHRDELIEQAQEKYLMLGGSALDCGCVKAGTWNEGKYTVASIQSLFQGLDKLDGSRYDVVIIDEAHHMAAPTYQAVYNRLRETNPNILTLGVTATPFRTDGLNLQDTFEEMAFAIDILELMRLGYLVPVKGRIVKLDVDLDELTVSSSDGEQDFTNRSIAAAFDDSAINRKIVEEWARLGESRKTIFYLSSVDHAKRLAALFNEAGVSAASVDGAMNMRDRKSVISRFKSGQIKVLTNMNVLTEGFDDPSVECISLVRPTKSLCLYAQIIGRGLRISTGTGKRDCLILDFTGVSKRHEVIGMSELFGLNMEQEQLEEGIAVGALENPETQERVIQVVVGRGTEEFTFEGKDAVGYVTRIGNDTVITCGMNKKSVIARQENRLFDLYLVTGNDMKMIRRGLTQDYMETTLTTLWQREKDEFMESFKDRAQDQGATEKQMDMVERFIKSGRVKREDLPERITKLHACNIISYIFATKAGDTLYDFIVKGTRDGVFTLHTTDGGVYCHRGGTPVIFTLKDLAQFRKEGKTFKYPCFEARMVIEKKDFSIPAPGWFSVIGRRRWEAMKRELGGAVTAVA